jgi:hypothetical protein
LLTSLTPPLTQWWIRAPPREFSDGMFFFNQPMLDACGAVLRGELGAPTGVSGLIGRLQA